MPRKLANQKPTDEHPETPKKRVRKTVTKSTTRKIVSRRKKIATEEPAQILVSETAVVTVPMNRERPVEIRRVEKVPVSPYVIEFRATDEILEAASPITQPLVQPSSFSLRNPEPIFTSDFSALEEFFNEQQTAQKTEKVTPAPEPIPQPKTQRVPVLRPLITKTFSAFKTTTKRAAPSFVFTPPPRPLVRAAAAFAVIALIFTLPATGLQAYTKLEQTKDAILLKNSEALAGFDFSVDNPDALKAALGSANETLADIKNDLERAVGIFSSVLPLIPKAGSTYRSSTLLLDAGTHLTQAGRTITDGFAIMTDPSLPLGRRLLHLEEALRAAFPLIRAAEEELAHVKPNSLPARVRGPVTTLQALVPAMRAGFTQTLSLLPALESFLGTDAPKRYLVIFQNPHELRPTGGFIGSFALLDLDQGEITNLEVPGGGPYDLACCLTEHVIAPEPLHLIEPHWQFHDANWFPDFPTSAEKLMWFYGKSGGPSVDGVIAINATLIPELLALVGPIAMPSYGRTFTAENFISETQKIVELEYDRKENRPKAVIGDLAPILIERLVHLPQEKLLSLVETFAKALATKTIQLYSTNPETQTTFREAGWTGEMKSTNGDYLMVVSANIAGGKSNASIATTIEHHARIDAHGNITDEVRIQKTHTGAKGDLFSGVRNVDYVRIYVPEGSSLISASGFEIPPTTLFTAPDADYKPDEDLRRLIKSVGVESASGTMITNEHGKTVFGNWMQTDPGETTVAIITYRLPQPVVPLATRSGLEHLLGVPERLPYTLLVQAQSGAPAHFSHKLTAPELHKTWGEDSISQTLSEDLFTATLFER